MNIDKVEMLHNLMEQLSDKFRDECRDQISSPMPVDLDKLFAIKEEFNKAADEHFNMTYPQWGHKYHYYVLEIPKELIKRVQVRNNEQM